MEPYRGEGSEGEDDSPSIAMLPTIGSSGTRSVGGNKKKRKGEKVRVEKIEQKVFCGACRMKVSIHSILSVLLSTLYIDANGFIVHPLVYCKAMAFDFPIP